MRSVANALRHARASRARSGKSDKKSAVTQHAPSFWLSETLAALAALDQASFAWLYETAAAEGLPFERLAVMINDQAFTKTANCLDPKVSVVWAAPFNAGHEG